MPQVAFAGWTETQRATDIARQWLQIASSKDGVYVLAGENNGKSSYMLAQTVMWHGQVEAPLQETGKLLQFQIQDKIK